MFVALCISYRRHHTDDAISTLFFHGCMLFSFSFVCFFFFFLRRIRYDLFGSNVRTRVNERLHEEGAKTEKTTLALLLANNDLKPWKALGEQPHSSQTTDRACATHGASTNQRQSHIHKLIYSFYICAMLHQIIYY